MKININDYLNNKKFIQDWYLKYGENDPCHTVSVISVATMVPCLVTCFYIGEVSGWTPELMYKIQTFINFYGYTKIENIPESFPKEGT